MGLLFFPCRVIKNKIAFKKLMVHLCDLRLGYGFLDMIPKAQATKEERGKLDFIKIKKFCALKATIQKVNRQHTDGKKIPANNICDEQL